VSIVGSPPRADHELMEARVAAGLTRLLNQASEGLAPDLTERLRFARERALERTRTGRAADAALGAGAGGVSILGRFEAWWPRVAGLASAATLALGLVMLDHWQGRERAQVAAEVDALLLADSLPPAAYSDPGFVAFLKLTQP